MQLTLDIFKRNLQLIQQKTEAAATRAVVKSRDIQIMAVTKAFPGEYIEIARRGGIRLFGENRVQEAVEKYGSLGEESPNGPGDFELHLIGHLQRNKAKIAAETFCCVQSIDKLETAQALQRRCQGIGKRMDILLEMNTSGEESKYGFRNTDELVSTLDSIMELNCLRIRGLMTIGPFTQDTLRIRKAFAQLKGLYQNLKERYPGLMLDTLSMGMSGDFEIAIEEGSNMIRIGTALFGERE